MPKGMYELPQSHCGLGRAHCLRDYKYITPILSTLCVVDYFYDHYHH